MELPQESSSTFGVFRNLSSSSSAFVSANQSPFFSPRSPKSICSSESNRSEIPNTTTISSSSNNFLLLNAPHLTTSNNNNRRSSALSVIESVPTDFSPEPSLVNPNCSSNGISSSASSSSSSSFISQHKRTSSSGYSRNRSNKGFIRLKKPGKYHGKIVFARTSASLSSSARLRSCDVYIGFHGRQPQLLKFAKWFRTELELQGIACFAADRARCRSSRSHEIVDGAINAATFGVVIVTKKSFSNQYSIDELRNFLGKKNLVPIFFDLGPSDCLARDIIERRGELWEEHGGDLWMLYGGSEKEWKEAVEGLSRVDEWRLQAHMGNWRECILKSIVLLGNRLGRRSAVERVKNWKEKVEIEEYPFPRNDNFVGRKKELLELELILFGEVGGDGKKEYFELDTSRHRRKSGVIGRRIDRNQVEERVVDQQAESRKGKEPVVWKETENEIEMQRVETPQRQACPWRGKSAGRYGRRKRSMNILCGKGIACVSGESGIGKTELLLEFAYRFSQRYKMVLWVGGESKYIRQNYLNLLSFLGLDVSAETQLTPEKYRTRSFEEQEVEAIRRVRKELMRDIPFLVVIDNLERERDWWDGRDIMELLPRFGGETHIIISTRLPRIMNLEPMKLSYLSSLEAMSLMKGRIRDLPIVEIDALRAIEEKLGRMTLGLGLVGAILSELPINPSRLLDNINRMPTKSSPWNLEKDSVMLRPYPFLEQLLDVCLSIFAHADGHRNLATRMVSVSGWFAPSPIPISLLALTAHKVPEKNRGFRLWNKCLNAITCNFMNSHIKRSEAEASAMLVRFGLARNSTKPGWIHFHEIIRQFARKRGGHGVAQAMVQAVSSRGSVSHHSEHLWAACFLLFKFGSNPIIVELKVPELVYLIRRVVLPLAILTFSTYSRCHAALNLLALCTDALDSIYKPFVTNGEKWLQKSICWKRSPSSKQQVDEYIWQDVALLRATLLESRAKLMLRGGQYDIGVGLCEEARGIRRVICGPDHPDTISADQTLAKLVRFRANTINS